ncbi:MAG: phosphoribosylaminoimidazolesuccinocarboxamide synthase [Gemmatimonadota bacterium]
MTAMLPVLSRSTLPLSLHRRGKVREVYEVDAETLLLVASDRVSAFDVVMREPVPMKGAVLTQLSAFWFGKLSGLVDHHLITADADEIVRRVPMLKGHRSQVTGRAMLVRRTEPVPFECVVRGYLSGSAWREYKARGTLAGETLAAGFRESDRFDPPVFSPATKAETGHDENVTFTRMRLDMGPALAEKLKELSLLVYATGRDHAATRGILIADTKFEFGNGTDGHLRLIDEVLTPDSSRFWPADRYAPGGPQPSFDKQPLRDYLSALKHARTWNGDAPPPALPAEVVAATSERYQEAFRLLTGRTIEETF